MNRDNFVNILLEAESNNGKFRDQISEFYFFVREQVSKRIRDFYNEYSKDGTLQPHDVFKNLSFSELATFRKWLKRYLKEAKDLKLSEAYIKRLQRLSEALIVRRFDRLEIEIIREIEIVQPEIKDLTFEEMSAVYLFAFESGKKLFPDKTITNPNDVEIKKAVGRAYTNRTLEDRLNFRNQGLLDNLNITLTRNISSRQKVDKVIDACSDVMKKSAGVLELELRTEVTRFVNQALIDVYQSADVKKVLFVAILDGVTSVYCKAMNGSIIEVKYLMIGINAPPLHRSCRSILVPA